MYIDWEMKGTVKWADKICPGMGVAKRRLKEAGAAGGKKYCVTFETNLGGVRSRRVWMKKEICAKDCVISG
jgi:hypothetical protein